jgi:hypothetical protein
LNFSGSYPALPNSVMKSSSQTDILSDNFIESRRLITGLKHALDVSYERVLAAGKERWERHFEGNDPSDACVTVRITSGKPTAGVLKKPAASLLYGTHRLTA